MNNIISILNFADRTSKTLDERCHSLVKDMGYPIVWEHCVDGHINESHYNRFTAYREYDCVIALDIDCLITNVDVLNTLCEHMLSKDITFAAMNENGPSVHRRSCYKVSEGDKYNGFFYILNNSQMPVMPAYQELDKMYRTVEGNNTNIFEPYWSLFMYLYHNKARHVDLQGYTHEDKLTTVLDYDGEELLKHTWMARQYDNGSEYLEKGTHRERIDKIYEEAKLAHNSRNSHI
jgi:hypothetical protein